jgi:pimeloyl-ACP methyl ester carboxylesterase
MDVRYIRLALGLEQWNLLGISYGTEVGQMLLEVDEPGTRAAVLDSVVPPANPNVQAFSVSLTGALQALDKACAEHGACAERFGNLDALARRTVDGFREAPLEVPGVDPLVVPSGTLTLNHHLAAYGLYQAMYATQLYPVIPTMLEAWGQRDTATIRAYVEQLARPAGPDWGYGMQAVAICTGLMGVPLSGETDHVPFWAEALVDGRFSENCATLGLQETDPLLASLSSGVPVLVMAGAMDPVTPPAFAKALLPKLTGGHYVEVPFAGHGVTNLACPASIFAAFLREPNATPDEGCIADMAPPDFVTEYKATAGPLRLMAAASERRFVSAGWAAVPTLLLLGALLGFPLAALGRRMNGGGVASRTPRLLAWSTAALALLGVALWALAIQKTLAVSPALLPLGLVGPTTTAAVVQGLAVLAGAAALFSLRGRRRPIGTTLAVALTAVGAALLVVYSVQYDLMG